MRAYQAIILLFFLSNTTSVQVQSIDRNESTTDTQNSTIDPYAFLHIIPNSDGSITRIKEFYPTVPTNSSSLAISRDITLNQEKNAWVRIYLPKGSSIRSFEKHPIVVFAHGGGFILFSTASHSYDNLCSYTANGLNALVISVNYRLAPEHRLPAAYDDILEVLYWIKEGKDEWLREYGDVSRCFLMGTSSGANTAYNVGLEVTSLIDDLKPLTLRGFILVQPFFGGVKRVDSELKLIDDRVLPLAVSDLMWELSLPNGTDRNSVYCNPLIGGGSSKLETIRKMGWRVAVLGCDGDPLFDWQVEFVKLLEKHGVEVKSSFFQGGYHEIYSGNTTKIEELLEFVRSVFTPLAH